MRKGQMCSKIFEDAKSFVPDYKKYHFKGRFPIPGMSLLLLCLWQLIIVIPYLLSKMPSAAIGSMLAICRLILLVEPQELKEKMRAM